VSEDGLKPLLIRAEKTSRIAFLGVYLRIKNSNRRSHLQGHNCDALCEPVSTKALRRMVAAIKAQDLQGSR
jgi:hypothetical protein